MNRIGLTNALLNKSQKSRPTSLVLHHCYHNFHRQNLLRWSYEVVHFLLEWILRLVYALSDGVEYCGDPSVERGEMRLPEDGGDWIGFHRLAEVL